MIGLGQAEPGPEYVLDCSTVYYDSTGYLKSLNKLKTTSLAHGHVCQLTSYLGPDAFKVGKTHHHAIGVNPRFTPIHDPSKGTQNALYLNIVHVLILVRSAVNKRCEYNMFTITIISGLGDVFNAFPDRYGTL